MTAIKYFASPTLSLLGLLWVSNIRKYMKNVLIWLDQGVNVILLLGYPDETLSARAYRHYLYGSKPYLKKIID